MKFRKIKIFFFLAAFTVSTTFTSCGEMLQLLEAMAQSPTDKQDKSKTEDNTTNNTTDGSTKSKTKTKTKTE